MALWTVVAAFAGLKTRRDDLLDSSRRGLMASAACAMVAVIAMTASVAADDFAVQFAGAHSSLSMPLRYLPAALLGAPSAALPAWAAGVGLATLTATRGCGGPREARAWVATTIAAAIVVALLVAQGMSPLNRAPAVPPDGAGLTPALQRGTAVAQALALLAGAAATAGGCALTLTALAARRVGDAWSRTVRRWNAAAFAALLTGTVVGVRRFAFDPSSGAWLADPDTIMSVIALTVVAWLVLLDRGAQSADRVVMRLLLSVGACATTTTAMALAGGTFVRSAGIRGGMASWVGAMPLGVLGVFAALGALVALVVLVAFLRRARGAIGRAGAVTALPRNAPAVWLSRAGLLLLAGAAVGSGFTARHDVKLGDAEIFRVKDPFGRHWLFRSQGISTLRRENYGSTTFTLLPERDGTALPLLSAESRLYLLVDDAPVASALVGGSHVEPFLETRLAVVESDASRPVAHLAFVPLAVWWLPGAALLIVGTLIAAFSQSSVEQRA